MSLFEQIKNYQNHLSGDQLDALNVFLAKGFPTKKYEEYKYTHLAEIVDKEYSLQPLENHQITQNQLDEVSFVNENFHSVVFVNGVFQSHLSDLHLEGGQFSTLKDAFQNAELNSIIEKYYNQISNQDLAFTNLNFALVKDGFFLYLPKNTVIEKPIQVFYLSQNQNTATFYNTRNLLIVEQGCDVEVIENHLNFDKSFVFTNSVTEIYVDSNAKADWHKLQNDSATSYLVDHTYAKQERDSLCTVNTFSFGGKLVRNNLDFIHNGENINSFMNGVTVIGNDQLVDHHTAVHHKTPNCESYQNYKGVFKDQAHGVFNGKVFVDKIAQKTNAYQQNNNVLLSEGARIDTKPQLGIFADDVKCSHGCTVGQLNDEALFYLRARGISKKEAEALLLFAFANDAMENIDIEPLKKKVSQLIADKLEVNLTL